LNFILFSQLIIELATAANKLLEIKNLRTKVALKIFLFIFYIRFWAIKSIFRI